MSKFARPHGLLAQFTSHVFIIWVNHPLNMALIHRKPPNQPWIPRITISLSLKPPSSSFVTWNHHHQPALSLEATITINHRSKPISTTWRQYSLSLSLYVKRYLLSLSMFLFITLQYACWLVLVVGATMFLHDFCTLFMLLLIVVHVFPMFSVFLMFSVFPMCPSWRELSKPNSIVWGFFV